MTKNHLPNYLRTHRKRVRLHQHQVAHLVGVRGGAKISRYEHDIRIPDLATVFALEIIYGTSARVLFAGIYEDARRLVHNRAELAIRGQDAVLASFARQILDAPVNRPANPHTTFSS